MSVTKVLLLQPFKSLCRLFPRALCESRSVSQNRPYSTHDEDRNSYVVLSDNGQVVVCWHPEPFPPYEHTKPLPYIDPEFKEADSVLKVQYRREAKHRFQPDGPTIPELAKLTYTTKHRWYPNNEKKYEDPDPPKDRDGI